MIMVKSAIVTFNVKGWKTAANLKSWILGEGATCEGFEVSPRSVMIRNNTESQPAPRCVSCVWSLSCVHAETWSLEQWSWSGDHEQV